MQPTKNNFQSTPTEATDNQMPFLFMWIETQSATSHTSARQFGEGFAAQKASFWEVTSNGEINSADRRATGYFFTATSYHDGSKEKLTFFMRTSGSVTSVYRFIFWAPADRYDALLTVYDAIVSSLEFNTL